ncbi:hypothetical protein CCACVL1_12038 [Corchorus capsularis]|uniref:Uncharacterized protein n=1 Tax=Corchorus capsularis TaxID=210143 RepID=A0A1R3IHY6_COCAP|nr:hypothetical protein CCACVL1_12038 [Corchorus capsularis]
MADTCRSKPIPNHFWEWDAQIFILNFLLRFIEIDFYIKPSPFTLDPTPPGV